MNLACFNIAGLNLAVEAALPFDRIGLPGRLRNFADPNPSGRMDIRVQWEQAHRLLPLPAVDIMYDPKHVWRMFKGRDAYASMVDIDYRSRWNDRPPQARLCVRPEWCGGLLMERMASRDHQPMSVFPLGPSELMIRTKIIFHDGLVFHASGIDDGGRGLLMVGRAGAGKSTQALLWEKERGVIVLSDDRVACRLEADGATIYGTPWGGTADIARNHQVPLSAILLIEKAQKNALTPLSPAQALPLLIARVFLPYWDPELLSRACDVLDRIIARIPVYRLQCRPEPAVIDLVRSQL